MSDKNNGPAMAPKAERKQRQRGGFAVGVEQENGNDYTLLLLTRNLLDTADGEKWLREHGEAGTSYSIVQIKRSGIEVAVEEVRQARLV